MSEEPGDKNLVSVPGQFPGITGQKFHVQLKDYPMLLAVGFAQNTLVITGWPWTSHTQTLSP